MQKSEILYALNYNKNRLFSYKAELKVLEEQYDVIQEFSTRCSLHIKSFGSSMANRKRRLSSFDSIVDRNKSAAQYKQKMSALLSGEEYSATISSIDQLQNSIAAKKRELENDMQEVERQISILESRVASLQYEYNNYVERLDNND